MRARADLCVKNFLSYNWGVYTTTKIPAILTSKLCFFSTNNSYDNDIDVKSPLLQLSGQRGHLRTEFNFFFLTQIAQAINYGSFNCRSKCDVTASNEVPSVVDVLNS